MAVANVRGFVQSFIKGAAAKGITAGKTLETLKGLGYGYRRTDFLADFRVYAKVTKVRDAYKYIPKKYRVPEALFAKPHKWQTLDYLYQGKAAMRNTLTGQILHRDFSVSADYNLALTTLEREAQLRFETYAEEYIPEKQKVEDWEFVGFDLEAAYKRKP